MKNNLRMRRSQSKNENDDKASRSPSPSPPTRAAQGVKNKTKHKSSDQIPLFVEKERIESPLRQFLNRWLWWEQTITMQKTHQTGSFQLDYLSPLPQEIECGATAQQIERAWKEVQQHSQLRFYDPWVSPLWRVLIRIFGWQYLVSGLYLIPRFLCELLFPILLSQILTLKHEQATVWSCVWWVSLFSLVSLARSFFESYYSYGVNQQIYGILNGLPGALYRKTLRLSHVSRAQYTAGQIQSLMTTDCRKITELAWWFHYLFWASPLKLFMAIGVLCWKIGFAGLVVIPVLALVHPLVRKFNAEQTVLWKAKTKFTDERISLTTELIHAIQVIKAFAWERRFVENISNARAEEEKKLEEKCFSDQMNHLTWNLIPYLLTPILFLFIVLRGEELTAEKAWTTIAVV